LINKHNLAGLAAMEVDMRKLILAAAAAFLGAAVPAAGGTPVAEKMKCPVGGKEFTFNTTSSYSTWGERPDGKPYGSWEFPLALPECPDNGLVLYKDYDPDEVAKLEPLVASEAYQALRGDVPYYRAYWLMTQMDVPAEGRLLALLRAAWQADEQPELRARYLAEFAQESAGLPAKPDDLNWIAMEARAANALRELGRFDEASARLAKLPLSALAVAEPKAGAEGDAAGEARVRRAWHGYIQSLSKVIARADASAEPFDMLPKRVWMSRCEEGAGLSEAQKAYCTEQSGAIEEARAARAKLDAELKAIAEKREKSGR
jgi:hypothetical protein